MDLQICFILSDSKLNIFKFWTVDQRKKAIWRHQLGLLEIVMDIFLYVLTFAALLLTDEVLNLFYVAVSVVPHY